ncbi:hypothetical protein HanXRQr2_Chr14g0642351 [Helianthus annuus]|uniref:Uncharacterized protein n=1 Tax=Helianthus annuus TaxID=4232 RepID=A0A9K3E8Q5_HELAN|nr:hypothetical protein HanXRQr2_Chr14g0642351 [Helianthus annuus]KAJ0840232.1 hypothetical protein HanPSC8_Chr14g0616261 [Helianthus annuus]
MNRVFNPFSQWMQEKYFWYVQVKTGMGMGHGGSRRLSVLVKGGLFL